MSDKHDKDPLPGATPTKAVEAAVQLHRAGRLAEAERLYRQALEAEPNNAHALHLLGVLTLQVGRAAQAIELINEAIRRDQSQAAFHGNLAEAYRAAGDLAKAIACNEMALRLQPDYTTARANLGTAYHQQGNLLAAAECFGEVLRIDPNDVEARISLGEAQRGLEQPTEAENSFRRAALAAPDNPRAHAGLGLVLFDRKEFAEARAALETAIRIDPNSVAAQNNLGIVLKEMRQVAEAERHHRHAIQLDPRSSVAHSNLGGVLADLGRHDEAVVCLTTAVTQAPGNAPAYSNLARSLVHLGRLDEAITAARRAIELNSVNANAHSNLGSCLRTLGRLDDAIASYRTAMRLDPRDPNFGSNLVYTLCHHAGYDPVTVFAEHCEWARTHTNALTAASQAHENDRTLDRRLRIGYVSAQFCDHAVNFFSEPILASHDHAQFEVFCYSNRITGDKTTERLKSYADHWREIHSQSDDEASRLVRRDRIDILVDLAGHIMGNRLLLFARKPAPVQVTYLGYQHSTGMQAMDYRLTDDWADPPRTTDEFYTEKLVRLPKCFFCYRPSPDAPPTSALPALTNGYVTFGSLNNFAKVTPEVLATWADILHRVPHARIVILAHAADSLKEYLARTMAEHGIGSDRWTVADRRPRHDYLNLIQQIDVALDPFPFNGHTTTCDALWQGVPVVTLAGRTYASRFGSSAHANLGLQELVADSTEQYVEIAAHLAGDSARMQQLRGELRSAISASVVMDAAGFTRNVEAAYREMWQRYCRS